MLASPIPSIPAQDTFGLVTFSQSQSFSQGSQGSRAPLSRKPQEVAQRNPEGQLEHFEPIPDERGIGQGASSTGISGAVSFDCIDSDSSLTPVEDEGENGHSKDHDSPAHHNRSGPRKTKQPVPTSGSPNGGRSRRSRKNTKDSPTKGGVGRVTRARARRQAETDGGMHY